MKYFLKDLVNFKSICPFCSSTLSPTLTNFSGSIGKNILPIINSKLINNQFSFLLNYTSQSVNLNSIITISLSTNHISPYSEQIQDVLEQYKLYLSINCINKSCKMNYYIASDPLHFNNHVIKPTLILFESCNIKNFWIQNDFYNNQTHIVSTKSSNNIINIPLIKFENFSKSKLTSKINTIISFI